MEGPCVTLHTKKRPTLLSDDGFEGVTDVELETLLQKSRDTLTSIEIEVQRRQLSKASHQSWTNYINDFRSGIARIKILERLDGKATERVKTAMEILTTPQTVRSCQVYQTFLQDVLRHCGPEVLLLCAGCLARTTVASIKAEDRIQLLDHVKTEKSSYVSPILTRLATEYIAPLLHDAQNKKRKYAESTSFTPVANEVASPGRTREGENTLKSVRVNGHVPNFSSHSATAKESETAGIITQVSAANERIELMYSQAPIDQIQLLNDLLGNAIQHGQQWKREREMGKSTTDCLTTMIPKDPAEDISLIMVVGRTEGFHINEAFKLKRTWSTGHDHSSLQPHSLSG